MFSLQQQRRIAAVVHDHGDGATEATLRGLAAQTSQPDGVVVATSPARCEHLRRRFGETAQIIGAHQPLSAATERALDASPDWVWLLEGGTTPLPDALATLHDQVASWGDAQVRLLSSKLVDETGAVVQAEAPMPQALDPDLAAEGFERGVCSLRIASYGSLLLRGDAFGGSLPAMDGAGADLMWTARLLEDGVGLLVPESVVVAPVRTWREQLELVRGWARLLASDALPAREKPWIGFIYAERAAALAVAAARGLRPGAIHHARPSR